MDDGPKKRTHWGEIDDTKHYGFAFNNHGLIDLVEQPELTAIFFQGPVFTDKMIPFEDLSNACIVYHVAQCCGVVPGILTCGDKRLIQELEYRMSPSFTDIKAEVQLLIKSWNNVAKHSVTEPYSSMRPASILLSTPFGDPSHTFAQLQHFASFDVFIRYYMLGTVKIMAYSHKPDIEGFLKIFQRVDYNLKGLCIIDNCLLQWPCMKACLDDFMAVHDGCEKVESLNKQLVKIYDTSQEDLEWQISGWLKLEIEDLPDEFNEYRDAMNLIFYYMCLGKPWKEVVGPTKLMNTRDHKEDLNNFMGTLSTVDKALSGKASENAQIMGLSESVLGRLDDDVEPPTPERVKVTMIKLLYGMAQRCELFGFKDTREPSLFANVGESVDADWLLFTDHREKLKDLSRYQLVDIAMKTKCKPFKESVLEHLRQSCVALHTNRLHGYLPHYLLNGYHHPLGGFTARHRVNMLPSSVGGLSAAMAGLSIDPTPPWERLHKRLLVVIDGHHDHDAQLANELDSATNLVDLEKYQAQVADNAKPKSKSSWGFSFW